MDPSAGLIGSCAPSRAPVLRGAPPRPLALLLGALGTGRSTDLREALRDRAHQPYREPLVPGLRRLLAVRHPDVIGFCLSGAGPSIAAFTSGKTAAAEEILRETYRRQR